MRKEMRKTFKRLAFYAFLPLLAGCQPGAGVFLGSLFGTSTLLAGGAAGFDAGLGAGGGVTLAQTAQGIATIANPEPASMILMGSGFLALKFLKNKIS